MNLMINVEELKIDTHDAYKVSIDCNVETNDVIDAVIEEDENAVIDKISIDSLISYHGEDAFFEKLDKGDAINFYDIMVKEEE